MERFLAQHDLEFNGFPTRWLDGLFLGNGDMGAMVWGSGDPLIFTLDKYDLWEERSSFQYGPDHTYSDLRALVEEGRFDEAKQKYESKYVNEDIFPTRLPLPRLEFVFPMKFQSVNARLRLNEAVFTARMDLGGSFCEMEGFLHANKNLLVLSLDTGRSGRPFSPHITLDHLTSQAKAKLAQWGYLGAEEGIFDVPFAPGGITYFYMKSPEGAGFRAYCVAFVNVYVEISNKYLFLLAFLTDKDLVARNLAPQEGDVPIEAFLNVFQAKFSDCLEEGYSNLKEEHMAFWSAFWEKNFISIPDNILENLFYVELYKMACNSRPGHYPCTLQGIWTIDGEMPPWAGDYHLDMNVEETYWGIYASNHLDLGEPLYRIFSEMLPKFQQRCQAFFGFEGAWTRCSLSLGGNLLNGYYTTEFWPGNGAWLAHLFWLHWRYSQDREFLRDQAFPFVKQFFATYSNLLETNEFGEYIIPLSNAPEYNENLPSAWGKNPNCDLALIRFLGDAILQACSELELTEETPLVERVEDVLAHLIEYPADLDGLQVMEGVPLAFSHRHHSHLMGIYPLGVISRDTPDLVTQNKKDEETEFLITQSLKKINQIGFWQWTGWSFPWMSAIYARAGNGYQAYWFLKEYFKYIRENTMHANGDSYGLAFSAHNYEPMTLEGGFCFVAAILEMLLQSHQGMIRVFPAVPPAWQDIRFDTLRAEGAFLISALRSKGKLIYISIQCEKGGVCRVRNDFDALVELARFEGNKYLTEKVFNERPAVFEFQTRPGDHYRLAATSYKATASAMEKLSWAQVTRVFNGANFFGYHTTALNPYLPNIPRGM